MFDKFFFFLFSCLCSVCFRNGLCLFVLLSLFYCITIIRSLLLYILMDFSPPSEDSESLGKLQSIYILHKIAVTKSDNAVLRVCTEINIYIMANYGHFATFPIFSYQSGLTELIQNG